MSEEASAALALFGGTVGWNRQDWTASDDRVRGGKSQSYLDTSGKAARFYGTLDVRTLGGAGFASQRTTGDDRKWDLSKYAGIRLDFEKGDKKRYTFILKDALLPPSKETGREQSTISWEIDFTLPTDSITSEKNEKSVFIPWDSFNPTYRGKLKNDADPIDLTHIKRMSFMMRSFFGTQDGDFSLTIKSISALRKVPPPTSSIMSIDTLRQVEDGAPVESPDNSAKYIRFQVNNALLNLDTHLHRRVVYVMASIVFCMSAYYIANWAMA